MSAAEHSLIFRDPEMFFAIAQTTPSHIEAEDLLRRAKRFLDLMRARENEHGDTGLNEAEIGNLQGRIKDELHHINRRVDDIQWGQVIRDLWGEEAWQQALSHRSRIYNDWDGKKF